MLNYFKAKVAKNAIGLHVWMNFFKTMLARVSDACQRPTISDASTLNACIWRTPSYYFFHQTRLIHQN
jgi:hypothetical protein